MTDTTRGNLTTWAYECSWTGWWYACDARTALDALYDAKLRIGLFTFQEILYTKGVQSV